MIVLLAIFVTLIIPFFYITDVPTNKNKNQKDWKLFPNKRPKESGWYLCTVENGSRIPMLLYYNVGSGTFTDQTRASVFRTYEVMVTKQLENTANTEYIMPDNERMERIYTDEGCDRTANVIAWKDEPRVYMGTVKNIRNTGMNRTNYGIGSNL